MNADDADQKEASDQLSTALSAAEFAFVITKAALDDVQRLDAIVDVDDLDLLVLVAGQLFVAEKVVLQTID